MRLTGTLSFARLPATLLVLFLFAGLCPAPAQQADTDTAISEYDAPAENIWKRAGVSALRAAAAPATWVPVAAAITCYSTGLDRTISDWAMDKTPVFGSHRRAAHASDIFRDAAAAGFFVSLGYRYGFGLDQQRLIPLLATVGAGLSAAAVNHQSTTWIKKGTGRLRPDTSDFRSFPSGHTSHTAVFSTLGARNGEAIMEQAAWRFSSRLFFGLLTTATAWARIEARKHYPSDVFAGAALGHFWGAFIDEFLLAQLAPANARVDLHIDRERVCLMLAAPF
jgi:membrane-associated phospholipid phosphatase